MNVTVFGATGQIGSQVVDQLRSHGHKVTAYIRNPSKLPARWGEDVNVVVGELSDPTAVDAAVAGADAVVTALGPDLSRKATGRPLVDGTAGWSARVRRRATRPTARSSGSASLSSPPGGAAPGRVVPCLPVPAVQKRSLCPSLRPVDAVVATARFSATS